MRWVTGLTMAITLVPLGIFLILYGWRFWGAELFVLLFIFPYIAVATTAWMLRHDGRASVVLMVVAIGVTGLGLCCVMGLIDPFVGLLVPLIQFLLWFIGGLVAGRRRVVMS